MPITMVQDGVFGDTGKGKLAHVLSAPEYCDVAVRAVGGGNAGHVIVEDTRKVALHVLPAGCLYEETKTLLGRGMVTHIPTLFSDAAAIQKEFGVDPLKNLHIANGNHILFDAHKKADAILEKRKGKEAVGTTGSGIGPAYADKALRMGMRFEELMVRNGASKEVVMDRIKVRFRKLLQHWFDLYGIEYSSTEEDQQLQDLLQAQEILEGKIVNTHEFWERQEAANEMDVMIEGAQGTELSVDEDYPYVTASPTSVLGHLQGSGLPLRELKKVIMTAKAYTTRVGGGPFPTRMDEPLRSIIQKKGGEMGSTTGRLRDTGWLHAKRLGKRGHQESADEFAILKGDIFDDLGPVKLAIADNQSGQPVYEEHEGWSGTNGVRVFSDLHLNSRKYHARIQEITGIPVRYIGTGRDKKDLIIVPN